MGVGQITDFPEHVNCEEEQEDLERFNDAFLDVVGNGCHVSMKRQWGKFQSVCRRFLFIVAQHFRLFPARFDGENKFMAFKYVKSLEFLQIFHSFIYLFFILVVKTTILRKAKLITIPSIKTPCREDKEISVLDVGGKLKGLVPGSR